MTSHSSIYFTHQTIAQPFPEEKIYIPLYKFEIIELGEVRHYANSNEQSDESPQHAIGLAYKLSVSIIYSFESTALHRILILMNQM